MSFDRIISRLVGRIADEVDGFPSVSGGDGTFKQKLAKNLSRIADNLDSLGTEVAPNPGGPSNPVLSSIQIGENNFDIAGAGGAPLPNGTAALDQLRWNASSNAWEASSGTTQTYSVLIATNDPNKVVEAVNHYETTSDFTAQPTFTIQPSISRNMSESSTLNQLNMVWADGAANPFFFGLVPNWTDWVGYVPDGETDETPNYTVFYRTGTNDPNVRTRLGNNHDALQATPTILRNFIRINGVAYDALRTQIAGPRPVDVDDWMGFDSFRATLGWLYTRPPNTAATVSLITQLRSQDALPPMLLSTRGFVLRSTANIILSFNEVLDVSTPPEKAAFDIQADERPLAIRDIFFISSAPTTMQIRARADRGAPVTGRERITVAYKPQITDGDLKDQAGNRVAGFSNVVIDFS